MLTLERLSHIYSPGTPFEHKAVDDISLTIEDGLFLGLIGHTGSGKSTLIKHFNGLLKPTSGRVLIDGEDIWADKRRLHKIRFSVGLVFQYPEHQLFEETVYKDIAFGPRNMGLSAEECDGRVREALRFVGLSEELMEKSPFELSGGQKRRVAIAGVIAMRPRILVLDEPTAGLDPKGRDDILAHLKAYHAENRSTVIIVSHDMEEIARCCRKVLVMARGKAALYDTVENVFRQSDKLKAIGLDIPQITEVFIKLRARGFSVDTSVFTTEQAAEEILRALRETGEGRTC